MLVEPAHIECLLTRGRLAGVKRSRARAQAEVPESVIKIRRKLDGDEETNEPAGLMDCGRLSHSRIDSLMGDVMVNRVTLGGVGKDAAERSGNMDKAEEIATEAERMKGLLLASIVGTDGLPPLNHALSTKLGWEK